MDMKLAETIANISLEAGALVRKIGLDIDIEDSRVFVQQIIGWAKEFEKKHENIEWEDDDYLLMVSVYTANRLKEYKKQSKKGKQDAR